MDNQIIFQGQSDEYARMMASTPPNNSEMESSSMPYAVYWWRKARLLNIAQAFAIVASMG
eukprot:m.116254 g.116254  ORF g.116254 m.116254 type:complete len:60 (+) comp15395_c0_seq2:123-302(+)